MVFKSLNLAFIWLLIISIVNAQSLLKEYSKASNASLLWGPYRPGLYVGVRPRIPYSLLSGLMWYNSDSLEGIQSVRHACDQGDDINGYGWVQYDPRYGGRQIIRDTGHQVDLTIEYVKIDENNWIMRVKGEPYGNKKTTIVFYSALEGHGSLDLKNHLESLGLQGDIELIGQSPDLGKFRLTMTEPRSNKHPSSSHELEKKRPSDRTHYASLVVPNDKAWLAKDIFLTFAQDSVTHIAQEFQEHDLLPTWNPYFLQNRLDLKGNMHFMQRTYEGAFEFDVVFSSRRSKDINMEFEENFNSALTKFEEKFNKAFDLRAPYNNKEYEKFAQEMISNLLGGIGYFYGDHLVDRSDADEYLEDEEEFWEGAKEKLKLAVQEAVHEGPYELFTCVPSRPFFPRGFYWDEGFHLIPVLDYDPDLAFEIIKSWFDLLDEDGWIAREQILGDEARSRVPDEFKVQFPHYANPPTLMMLFSEIVTKVNKNSGKQASPFDAKKLGNVHLESPELLLSYVGDIYPSLQKHFEWFRQTQKGEIKTWDRKAFSSREGYRWRGRTPSHCLASGLDDYPRAPIPHTGELHVDLLSWIGMFTRSMKNLAEVLGEKDDFEEYSKREKAIIRNLDDLHWSEANQTYCDVTIDDYDENAFVCHKGYVSLLPFMLKLMPADSKHLTPILNLIGDPQELWTSYGVASLSKKDEYFGKGEDYWRGSIWMNMNHLILDAFQYYHEQENISIKDKKMIEKLYKELRLNCVSTVYEGWKKTGFAYEHYSAISGEPVGVKHFLGWTSLVVEFMAMPEDLEVKKVAEKVVEVQKEVETEAEVEVDEQVKVEIEDQIKDQTDEQLNVKDEL